MPTPEELARINIDKLLTACGWVRTEAIQNIVRYINYALRMWVTAEKKQTSSGR